MATMREVASKAGVSTKTVSRVFNADPHVADETRAPVARIMQEVNYVPNVLATTFRAGKSPFIGVAVPYIVDPFFASIARAVEEVARTHGIATLITSLGDDPDGERPVIESLLARRLTGLVLAPVGFDHGWLKKWQENTPVAFVDRAPIGLTADSFTEADREGAFAAVEHLTDRGHRRIAYMGDHLHLSTESKRLEGYRAALGSAGIAYDESLVVAYVTEQQATARALDALGRLPEPPTAVLSSNARTSMSLVRAATHHRVALVSFGDFPLADALTPAITVIDQDPHRLGTLAAERIFERTNHPKRRFRRTNVLDIELIERDSSGPPSSR